MAAKPDLPQGTLDLLILKVAAGRILMRLVEGMVPAAPSTFVAMTRALAVVALPAIFLSARRASRVDPVKALRQE